MCSIKIFQTHSLFETEKELYYRNPKIVKYGTETISYMAPETWSKVLETIKMTSLVDNGTPGPIFSLIL